MNKRTMGIIVLVLIAITAGLAYQFIYRANHTPIYIALMVPDKDDEAAQRAITAIKMRIDEVGKIDGRPICLIIKEDGENPETAKQIVDELAAENKALVILGNIYSTPAIAVGEKLQSYGIPAITAGATAPDVTLGNPWFFRVVPDNTAQGEFIAGYASKVLEYKTAAIIFEDNAYGKSLSDGFENAFLEFNGEISRKFAIEDGNGELVQDVQTIVSALEENTPDVIFLAAEKTGAAAVITAMREARLEVPLIGGDDLGDQSFNDKFPEVQEIPGYYTESMYAASPLIFDITSDKTQEFSDHYTDILKEKPTWFSATSYDSALVALRAIQEAGISGDPNNIAEDRQKLREQLSSYNKISSAINGVTGPLFFDENNNVKRPLTMGQFSQGQFISAPIQLQPILDKNQVDNFTQALAQGNLIFLGDVPLYKTRIVYVGIDINEFSQIDINSAHEFSADFYLWFRYQGDIDIENIRFDNVSDPIELSQPIKSATFEDGTNYRLYHIQATFSDAYDLREYPFDKQRLRINFRHADKERHELIYVVDILGMSNATSKSSILDTLDRAEAFSNITDWHPTTGYFFQDTVHEYTTRGDPTLFGKKRDIEYSHFNAQIEVQRDMLRFTAKTMLPVFFIIMLTYLGFFLPGKQFEAITGIMTGTVLSVVFFHVDLSGRLNVGYNVALDYAFYIIYALLTTELLLSIIAWHKETNDVVTKRLFLVMRILYPLVLVAGAIVIVLVYNIKL